VVGVSGCLPVANLAANAGVSAKAMRAMLADLEARGYAEQVTANEWRLGRAVSMTDAMLISAIPHEDGVPLEPDELRFCRRGPAPTKAAA
jgi:hypothetical protein